MTTDDELRELIAKGEKATARPWQSFGTLVYSRNAVGMVCEMSYPFAELIEHRKLEHGDGKDAWDKSHDTREYLTAAANLAPEIAAELIAAREALVAVREWLWSGELAPGQKRGQPIVAPDDVAKIMNAALDAIPENGGDL